MGWLGFRGGRQWQAFGPHNGEFSTRVIRIWGAARWGHEYGKTSLQRSVYSIRCTGSFFVLLAHFLRLCSSSSLVVVEHGEGVRYVGGGLIID